MNEHSKNRQTGIIIAWSDDASGGIIQTPDMEPHYFNLNHWQEKEIKPAIHMRVTFEEVAGRARNIKLGT